MGRIKTKWGNRYFDANLKGLKISIKLNFFFQQGHIGQIPTRDSNGAGPVVVEMAEFVGQHLMAIQVPTGEVVDDVVVSGRHRSLVGRLIKKRTNLISLLSHFISAANKCVVHNLPGR